MGAFTFELAFAFYFIAMMLSLVELFRGFKHTPMLILICAIIGFGLHTANILYRGIAAGYVPITNPHEATSFFAWCIFLIFLVMEYRYKLGLLGSFIIPVAFALMLAAALLPMDVKPLAPILRSNWLGIHTVLAFLANAAFAMAAGVAVMYLVQEHYVKSKHLGGLFQRLPSLQRLDELNYRLITLGFPLFSLAIITGAVWAESAWGSYISWEPRQVWSLITWFIFGIILHARLMAGWRGKRAAVLSIIGFLTIIIAFAGVKILQKGLHVFL